jgi:dihydrofolate reductase
VKISIVVAVSRNNVIGVNGGLPWRLPEDLKKFKLITMGKPMIMGRATYASIGRALPGRRSIVLSRQSGFAAEGCDVAATVAEALEIAGDVAEVMIIGGGKVY